MTPHGSFTWNELTTGDVKRAKTFYGDLLGWTYRAMEIGGGASYTIIRNADQDAGGMVALAAIGMPQSVPPHWMSYIAVDDVDARTVKVAGLGGKVLKEPFDIPTVGPDERGRRPHRRRGLPDHLVGRRLTPAGVATRA